MTGVPPSAAVFEQNFVQAQALHRQGQLGDAEQLYRSVLAADAGHLPALLHLGVLRLQQGRNEDAVELTREALRRDPDCAEAHANLGVALNALGHHDEAVAAYETALAIDPDRAEAYYGLALALHAVERHDEAVACYRRALAIDPDYAEASCGLGAALAALKRYEQAIACYQRALDVDPDYVEAVCGLAEAFHALGRDDEAIAGYRRAIAVKPDHAQALSALGIVLQAASRHGEAIDCFRRALAIAPDYGDAQLNLGIALEEFGRIEEAHSAFERAIAIDPDNVRYMFSLVASRRVRAGDRALAALRTWEGRLDTLDADERILLHFALGKALSDVGRPEECFGHLLAGNALKRQTIPYDEAATLTALDRIGEVFSAELMRRNRGLGNPSALPVFIVGMPRSGSTLVEQILASHPRVFGGGERKDFTAAAQRVGIDIGSGAFAESAAGLSGGIWARLGAEYLHRLRAAAQSLGGEAAARITDKMPANFCFAGLIHLALPNARIVRTMRDPVDTCLSCFSKLFGAEQSFTYDLGELGRYHRACDGLMEHWRRVLPPGVMLDVQYEELVADFEPQARRIVAHCGLEWDDACLSFHQTRRVVRTASATQVRQPIYRSSIGRWRPADTVLRPLLDALANVAQSSPARA